ncbi:hypothetical protein B0H65DRAFT_542666 [Neurospora tetraspora]|uniref:Uncharacterized protein n=1 Tax=Neurospora tetraspora TaxID=94610 RepID=A0AAE0MMR6_9PEZI|nr:hypothetical protein B0H65DRAFT_542666 [Neurospora tetraspora]
MSDERATSSSTADAAMSVQPAIQAFRLRALPVEIQLQIYRDAWTLALPDENNPKAWFSEGSPRSLQLREQLSAISAMGAMSREMRSHVYAEFFSRTQAYITTDRRISTARRMVDDFCLRKIMGISPLLREQLQHVCLVLCHGSGVTDGSQGPSRGKRALMWLASLKRLKTLDVVFDLVVGNLGPGPMIHIGDDGTVIETWPFRSPFLDVEDIRRLPKLDKWLRDERAFSWEETPQLKELKEEFEKLAPASEDTEQRRYKFDQHIGVRDEYDWPSRSYQI